MFHKMEANQPQSIFRYLPMLSFTESYIYQVNCLIVSNSLASKIRNGFYEMKKMLSLAVNSLCPYLEYKKQLHDTVGSEIYACHCLPFISLLYLAFLKKGVISQRLLLYRHFSHGSDDPVGWLK